MLNAERKPKRLTVCRVSLQVDFCIDFDYVLILRLLLILEYNVSKISFFSATAWRQIKILF